ncbi:MAG: hypothetical protein JXX29_08880 [Deltaproteobacteria bacterium]|nr:hypothetical protein [Deltaproteobacteria bacterium]MBN2671775.1 hypothetical protein [Deltaproteobacteria bacterium]
MNSINSKQIFGLTVGLLATLFAVLSYADDSNRTVTIVSGTAECEAGCDSRRWPDVEKALQRELEKVSFVVHLADHWRNETGDTFKSGRTFRADVRAVKNPQTQEATIEVRFYTGVQLPRTVVLRHLDT